MAGHTLTTQLNRSTFTIKPRKNNILIGFLSIWLIAWGYGEYFLIGAVSGQLSVEPVEGIYFIWLWLLLWTIGGLFTLRIVVYLLNGCDI